MGQPLARTSALASSSLLTPLCLRGSPGAHCVARRVCVCARAHAGVLDFAKDMDVKCSSSDAESLIARAATGPAPSKDGITVGELAAVLDPATLRTPIFSILRNCHRRGAARQRASNCAR